MMPPAEPKAAVITKVRVLVVEDDEDVRDLLVRTLEREGYAVSSAQSGEEALRIALKASPSLIILDVMLPGIDGIEVCRQLRADTKTRGVPIVMLTAKSEDVDIVLGLEMGADDYITKPFSTRVLISRLKAVLRRRASAEPDAAAVISVGDISIDPGRHEVTVRRMPVTLTSTEFKLLHYLASHPGWVFTRYQIVEAVRGEDYMVTERAVDVQIVGLRKKLAECGDYIETVRGFGYRFREQP
jgi:two-component system alkaline phosphatase synthesis response regulator PhoP